uniref:Uncharacterized protein n=1 Tax=Knipowitschia caucasica TaxID=637954 RepID=A0AAV2KA01_KNICA
MTWPSVHTEVHPETEESWPLSKGLTVRLTHMIPAPLPHAVPPKLMQCPDTFGQLRAGPCPLPLTDVATALTTGSSFMGLACFDFKYLPRRRLSSLE